MAARRTSLLLPQDMSDEALRDQGLSTFGAAALAHQKTLVIACGALAREIIALIELNKLEHITLTCLPAILHNRPEKIPQAVEKAIEDNKAAFENILVAYGDCGTGGQLQATCDRLGATMIDAPHCYAFFDGMARFTARDEITSFYLTDFLARQFDAFVWKPLGLDRYPELLDMYFGNYEKLVYMAQTEDPELVQKAQAHAEKLGLKFELRQTEYGELTDFIVGSKP
jgi:hypothetical protein